MFDMPIQDVKVVQEYAVDRATLFQASNGATYQLTEIDLSFSDALAGLCSGDASSGPVDRPTTKSMIKKV